MKNTYDEVILNDAYHTLKSPIVSIKSMLFVLRKNKSIEDNKIVQEKVFQIEEKLNILHKRAEIFLNYVVFKEGNVEFLYSFFNIEEILQRAIDPLNKELGKRFSFKKTINQPIMADEGHITSALRIIFTEVHMRSILGIIPITVFSSGKSIEVSVKYTISSNGENMPHDRDEENVMKQQEYIASRIIELHGGRVSIEQNSSEVELKISLPMKAKVSSRK